MARMSLILACELHNDAPLETQGTTFPPLTGREERLLGIRLHQELARSAFRGIPTPYRALLTSVATTGAEIDARLVRHTLETLMDEDAAAGRPFAMALTIVPNGVGCPPKWFFDKAQRSGRLAISADELEALAFHARELQRAISYYRAMTPSARRAGFGSIRAERNIMLVARDIMTCSVISVQHDATIADVAETLVRQGISGIPVLNATQLVGIVTEGDLLRRPEIGTLSRTAWWEKIFRARGTLALEYTREHSKHVADVMTREVVTVEEDTPIVDIADLFVDKGFRRVPVVLGPKLVGIVSRSDIVRALALAASVPEQDACDASDESIAQATSLALRQESWSDGWSRNFSVLDRVVTLYGSVESEEERHASQILCENIPGVREVKDRRGRMSFPPIGA